MDKVMLVESLGYNLMSVSMLCDLDMVVVFGKYRCVVIMEADNSKVFEGFRRGDLYIVDFSTGPQPAVCLLAKASCLSQRRAVPVLATGLPLPALGLPDQARHCLQRGWG